MSDNKVKSDLKKQRKKGKSKDRRKSSKDRASLDDGSFQKRLEPSVEAQQAGKAALMRVAGNVIKDHPHSSSSPATHISHRKNKRKISKSDEGNKHATAKKYIDQAVFFKCPFLSSKILTKEEWINKIHKHLNRQLELDKSKASCLMIRSLNELSKSVTCIETMVLILDNIMSNPDDEKYKKIRIGSKVFQERILQVTGGIEFLEAVGFVKDGSEGFYIYPSSKPDNTHLQRMLHLLTTTEPIVLELYRDVKVIKPSDVRQKVELQDDFFVRNLEEIKREHTARLERLESSLTLKTRDMNDVQKSKHSDNYLYTFIRVRFPDGIFLQATFDADEKLEDVRALIDESTANNVHPFRLSTGIGSYLQEKDYSKTLRQLNLIPAVVLIFTPPKALLQGQSYLAPSILKK